MEILSTCCKRRKPPKSGLFLWKLLNVLFPLVFLFNFVPNSLISTAILDPKSNGNITLFAFGRRAFILSPIPANIYLFKVNNRNPRKRCEICSQLKRKTPERRRRCSGVLLLTLNIFHTFF